MFSIMTRDVVAQKSRQPRLSRVFVLTMPNIGIVSPAAFAFQSMLNFC